jgi:hypothetical protein
MSLFKRIFAKDSEIQSKKSTVAKASITFAQLNYPPKIILAWVKALEGNTELALFLLDNGYEELYHTTQALLLKDEARNWLMNNGYPHLMAMVNAAEGNGHALRWLQMHGFEHLYHVANAVEGEMESFEWLKTHTDPTLFLLTRTIKKLKDQIEFNHNDMYSFGKDY